MRSNRFVVFAAIALVSMVLATYAPVATPTQVSAQVNSDPFVFLPLVSSGKINTLRVNGNAFPDNLDPQQLSFSSEIAHVQLVYEGLTRLDKDLTTIPAAAETWVYNADATELTFTLRKDLTYSDGGRINAKRFEFSILRNIDPTTHGEYASITDTIKGATAWRSANLATTSAEELARLKSEVKVQALDAVGAPCTDYAQADCLTLKIGLAQTASYFHVVMGLWVTYPVKEEIIKAGGVKWWINAQNHIGNGPFIWQTLEVQQKSVFVPNTHYWRGIPKYNVEYRYIVDSAAAFAAYKNNEFDVVGLNAADLNAVNADPVLSQQKAIYPGACTFAIMFHQLKEPFTDFKVRAAFAYGLDREGWVNNILAGMGSPTLTWIPKGYPGYDAAESRWGYNPVAARQAITESSYGSVANLPEVTLTFSDSPRNRLRFEWLVNMWKNVFGPELKLKLNPVDAATYTALTKDIKTAPQVFVLGWCADYPHPQNWLSTYWRTGAFGALIGYSNPALDTLMAQADSTLDETTAMGLYGDAQRMLTTDVPVAFMWNNVTSFMVKPWVKGYHVTPQDHLYPGDVDPLTITIQK
jgi:oligopeptide transport system substrate-binding protein